MKAQTGYEQRRALRRRSDFTAMVTDAISGRSFGQLGNLSATGMLLISPTTPRKDAIYQLRLPLPGLGNDGEQIEVGVQEQWHEPAASPGQVWAGFRILAISEHDAARLESWLALPS